METNLRHSLPRWVTATAGAYALLVGVLTILGYALGIRRLTDWNDGGLSMFPNTAAGAVLSGSALLLMVFAPDRTSWKMVLRIIAVIVGLIGGLTLLEHLTGMNLGIDTVLFDSGWNTRGAVAPMRMGPPASSSYFIIGGALIFATYGARARRVANFLGVAILAITSMSLVGYWFGADQLFGVARFTGIAVQTSTVLAALGIGLIAAIPEHGFTALLGRDDAGGVICRRLLLPIIALPLLLGYLRVRGQEAGYFDTAFGTSLLALVMIAMLVALLWWTASDVGRSAELARAADAALHDADRRKDEFLATLAHELRNPLAPMIYSLQIMKSDNVDEGLAREACAIMDRQVAQMVRLVDDLLDVGRISRGKLELRKAPMELNASIHQAVEACRPLADSLGHQLDVVLPTETIHLHADAVRLTQVLGNLLNNACKYTSPGGKISLRGVRENGEAIIRIKDNGVGIAADMIARVFEIFTQVEASLERSRGGLGIGLTLVKRLVEMHGGTIEAHSEGAGRGSEFIVRLPIGVDLV